MCAFRESGGCIRPWNVFEVNFFQELGDGMGKLQIRQVRSTIGRDKRQGKVLESLGITRIGIVAEHEDTPQIRGMINKVSHLVSVTEIQG